MRKVRPCGILLSSRLRSAECCVQYAADLLFFRSAADRPPRTLGFLAALSNVWLMQWPLSVPRPHRWAFIGAGAVLVLVLMRVLHAVVGTVRIDDARLVVPTVPVTPAAQPIVAQEYGRLGRLYVREGAAVAPGDPLFSLQRDPQLDQELVDRGVARDLAEVNEQSRDTRREIDSVTERIVMVRAVRQPFLEKQISLARDHLLRREQLWQEGAISRDLLDESRDRLLELQQDFLERQQDRQRLVELQQLLTLHQVRLRHLTQSQVVLRQQDQQRRDASRRHPRLDTEEQARLDYATYRSPARGVVLRLLKQPGDPVRPRETVAIWQREQQPPQVEALLPSHGSRLMASDQLARVEVPSLRQVYNARLQSWRFRDKQLLQARFNLEGLPESEARRLLALPGEPVRVEMPRRLNLLYWLQTGQTVPSMTR